MCNKGSGPGGIAKSVSGISLIELILVLAIISLLSLVGGLNLYEARSRNDVLNCAKRMASDIKMARRRAQGSGGRIVVEFTAPLSFSPRTGADVGPTNLHAGESPAYDEFYTVYEDTGATGAWSSQTILRKGTNGDPLCDENIVFKGDSTLATSTQFRLVKYGGTIVGGGANQKRMLFFSSKGTLLHFGATDRNLYLEKNGQVARLQVVGLTGATRIYVNKGNYADCGGGACVPGSTTAGVNNYWQPIQQTL